MSDETTEDRQPTEEFDRRAGDDLRKRFVTERRGFDVRRFLRAVLRPLCLRRGNRSNEDE